MTNFVSINSLSTADRDRLRGVIHELNDSMTRAQAEHDFQKDAITAISESLNLDKKLVRRLAKTYYNANYNAQVEDNRNFEEFYSILTATVTVVV